ncbi:hypothetical protein, partial [Microbulbifer elongatus]|uniref:hypothetical protein n=1 Tax=Microbulbifer elongatus TaxID=86173 RepID=UPI00210DD8D7
PLPWALGISCNKERKVTMGTRDRLWVKVSCESCKVFETTSVSDKGSGWGGSYWGNLSGFTSFTVKSTGSGKTEPTVESAICNNCNTQAKVEEAYGFGKPAGF